MKKKIVLFSFVLVLVCAVLTGCAVTAFNKGDNNAAQDDVSLSTQTTASVPYISDAPADKTFTVSADGKVEDKVKVVDNLGNAVKVNFTKTASGNYKVAPAEAYAAGVTYRIIVSDDAAFVGEFYGFSSVDFTIEKAEVENVVLNDGVVVLEYGEFSFDAANGKIYTANNDVVVGGYVVAPISADAYNAYRVDAIESNSVINVLSVSDPEQLSDVFEDINITKNFVISDGELVWNEEALADLTEEFKPFMSDFTDMFNISFPRKEIDKDNNKAYLDIKISFTYKGITFSITVANDISFTPSVNYSTIPFSASVGADITVVTTTTLKIEAGYSLDKTWAVEELMKKIDESHESSFTKTLAKLAHWEVAYGPLSLAYDLDIVLTISLKGELDASATITTNYDVGAYYIDKEFKAWCNKGESSGFKMNEIELYGVIGTKVGFNNALELKIIQIAKVGIEVELGFYLDVWGCVKVVFPNGDFSAVAAAAGIYGDFGFYVDIKLVVSAGIPGIDWAKIGKDWTLFSKKWSIFTFGNPELDVCYVTPVKEVVLTGSQGAMPAMEVKVFNLLSRSYSVKTVAYADNNVQLPTTCYFDVDANGTITLKEDAPAAFGNGEAINQEVLYSYDGHGLNKITGSVFVVKVRNMPYAINSVVTFEKTNPQDVDFALNLLDATYEGVEGIASEYVAYDNGVLSIDSLALVSKDSGRFEFYVKTSKNVITLWIDVYGTLSLKAVGSGTASDPYVIYGRDQLDELSAQAAANNYYNGMSFKLANNISYNGREFTPISRFQGVLNGNGYAITDLKISSLSGDYAAFIIKNEGIIKNLTVSANMEFDSRVVYAGVIAGLNANGAKIENCVAQGSIKAQYKTGVSSHADFKIGGAVAVNEGEVKNVASYTCIDVTTTGVSIKSHVYVAGVIGYNTASISDSAYYGSISANCKKAHNLAQSDLSNNY